MNIKRMEAEPWFLDSFSPLNDREVLISGWCLKDPAWDNDELGKRFLVNGSSPAKVKYPLQRTDVQEVFLEREDAAMCGFELTAPLEYENGICVITAKDSLHSGLSTARGNWYVPDFSLHTRLPEAANRFRVIANNDESGFLIVGATDAFRLAEAYFRYTGRPLWQAGRVLDWGVGCGRIARHLIPHHRGEFLGCDIDADNVAWCHGHLEGSFFPCRLGSPLAIETNSVDVVYGVSVFTHLSKAWEEFWLGELHRILKPGGVLMASVHGETTINFSAHLNLEQRRSLRKSIEQEGLFVNGGNDQLSGFVEHPEEYVNAFHHPNHIKSTWGRLFRHIERLPGYIFTHDLIIGQK